MLFCSLYVPDLVAEALVRTEPVLREQPLAVLAGTPPLVRVCAVNAAARAAGVEIGMPKLQAAALAGLKLRMRAPAQEAAATAALLDCAHAFSPRVEPLAPDAVLLDATGLERMFGAPPRLGREIARRAAEVGLEVNVALAANREAAIHAAQGFAGVTVIPAGEEAQRLGALPVELLVAGREYQDKSEEFLQTLSSWGVRTWRAFAALPVAAVAQRLGRRGVALQKLACGAGSNVLVAAEPPLHFEETLELEHPVELLEPLAFLLARMLEPLCARLAARALAANELRLELTLDAAVRDEEVEPRRRGDAEKIAARKEVRNCESAEVRNLQTDSDSPQFRTFAVSHFRTALRFPVPLCDARVFLKLLQLDLQSSPPPAPVLKLRLAAEPARPQVAQHGLFEPTAPAPEKLQLLLARLAEIVGAVNVGAAELEDSHRRERYVLAPFTEARKDCGIGELRDCGSKRQKQIPRSARDDKKEDCALATRIFRPPLPVTVEVHAGRPVRVVCHDERGHSGDVVWAAGPWRSSGEWWMEVVRDESQVAGQKHAALSSSPVDSRFPEMQLTPRCAESRPTKHSQREAARLTPPPAMEVNIGGYQYPNPVVRNQESGVSVANPRDTDVAYASGFAREEWDVAVRPDRRKPVTLAGRSLANEPPQPELVLWRLVQTHTKEWWAEGAYD